MTQITIIKELPRWLQFTLIALVVLTLVFLYLWQGWQVIHLQQRVSELDEELTPLREQKKKLQLQEARYFSYERIERVAKERFGMIEPEIREEESESD